MADVVDIPEFRAFYYTDDTPRQFYTLRRYEDESGSGKMHCYNIAPGIQLSFNDLNLSSCYQPLNVQKDFLEINYCLEGGHEVEMVGGGITFLGEKDLSILDPKMSVGRSIEEPLLCFFHLDKGERKKRCHDPDTQRFYSKFSVLRDFLSGMRSDA